MDIVSRADENLTPMMNQYLQIKKECKDAILFFRLGDFYEMFFDDAKTASSILGLALTSREAGKDNRVPMCGIPYHAADSYIARLVKQAHKVAICEQVEDPRLAKGIVKREIIRVITPGTLISQNVLNKAQNNYLCAVYQPGVKGCGLAVADLSTGEFNVTELENLKTLLSELTRLMPAELLLSARLRQDERIVLDIRQRTQSALSDADEWTFDYAVAYDKLISHFNIQNLRGFGCEDMPLAISAAGAALHYMEQTQKTNLVHINRLKPYSTKKFMLLDSAAQRNLELTSAMHADSRATLLNVLNFTQTPMGRRLIMQWIQQPLLDIAEINKRLDAVEELQKSQFSRSQLRDTLKGIGDIERLLSRISLGIANARDICALNQSLKIIPELKRLLGGMKGEMLVLIRDGLEDLKNLVRLIDDALRPDAPISIHEGGMIRNGFNEELDKLLEITRGGRQWMASLQKEEIQRTGITSLKVKYNQVFGYYIEITKANLHLVPSDYIRRQTLVNAERFITPALKEQEEKILGAEEKVIEMEHQLFLEICREVLNSILPIQVNAAKIAMADVFNSLAEAAVRGSYTRPKLNDSLNIKIRDGRHPVLENILPKGKFIPNDIILDCGENQVLIITGPNMAGKSTYIRQAALIVLMAQIGSFVPAKEAEIGLVDKIFTRLGAADDISAGLSTFMMEMSETANILNNITARSLVILDEIGRGTSTFDGLSIAWAAAEYLHKEKSGKPKTLFATHYHELAELELTLKGVKNYNAAVKEQNDEVVFLYKLVKGFADHSYGIHVGRLAGLPKEVIDRAREILGNLEINSVSKEGIPSLVKTDERCREKEDIQLTKSRQKQRDVIDELCAQDTARISPLQALNLIDKWQKNLN